MIRMKNVTEVYDSSDTVALDGIDLKIDEGEFVFLVGPSGSGKTTLMKLITGEVRPTNGTVIVNDFDMMKIMRVLVREEYDGAIYPDHVFRTSLETGGDLAAFAYAMGYLKGLMHAACSETGE